MPDLDHQDHFGAKRALISLRISFIQRHYSLFLTISSFLLCAFAPVSLRSTTVRHILHPPQTTSQTHSHTHLLSQPLLTFIHAIAQAAALERPDAADRFPVWTIRGSESLQRVWGLCVATGGHRIWGVDESEFLFRMGCCKRLEQLTRLCFLPCFVVPCFACEITSTPAGKPSFVVSLTDILRCLSESIPQEYFSAEYFARPGLGSGAAVEAGAGGQAEA